MLRVTVLGAALAISVAACTGKEKNGMNVDTALGNAASAGSTAAGAMSSAADSMGSMAASAGSTATSSAAGAIDTMSSRAGAAMDTMASKAGTAMDKAKSAAGAGAAAVGAAASSAALRTKLSTLSSDQVSQLQKALNDNGCDVGTVDGVMGARTRQGVECGLEKNNISDADVDSLYRALNLNFGS